VRPTHVFGPLNHAHNETFFFDRLVRGRPVLRARRRRLAAAVRSHVEDLADAMAAMLGDRRAFGRAYNVSGEESITQVGFGRADRRDRQATGDFVHVPKAPSAQNLVYDCHAVYTTTRIRRERASATLHAGLGLGQTFEWYLR